MSSSGTTALQQAYASSDADGVQRDSLTIAHADKTATRQAVTATKLDDIKNQTKGVGHGIAISGEGMKLLDSATRG
jgi:hypothetical protein